jgi:hypothetical protein
MPPPTLLITKNRYLLKFCFTGKYFYTLMLFFCSTLSEFENFLLCERIVINVTTKRNVRLILKILSDLEPSRGSSNKKTLYATRSCVNWALFGTRGLSLMPKKAQFTHEPLNKLLLNFNNML